MPNATKAHLITPERRRGSARISRASQCNSPTCPSVDFQMMKLCHAHGSYCNAGECGSFSACNRIGALLSFHASDCQGDDRPVPSRRAIGEQYPEQKSQQQEMDDLVRQNDRTMMVTRRCTRDSQILETDGLVRQTRRTLLITRRWKRDGELPRSETPPDCIPRD